MGLIIRKILIRHTFVTSSPHAATGEQMAPGLIPQPYVIILLWHSCKLKITAPTSIITQRVLGIFMIAGYGICCTRTHVCAHTHTHIYEGALDREEERFYGALNISL